MLTVSTVQILDFTYDMFSPEQLELLKGAKGDTGIAGTTNYNNLENKPDLSKFPFLKGYESSLVHSNMPYSDLNLISENSVYYCAWGTLNAPNGNFFFCLTMIYPGGSAWRTQVAYGMNASVIFIRHMADSVWSAWSQL